MGPPAPLPFELQVMSAATAVVFLAIALLAAARRASGPLARELALLSAGVFTYNILEVAYSATHQVQWAWAEYAAASLMAIPTLRLFVGFVGMGRRLRWAMRLCSAAFIALAITCLAAFWTPSLHDFPGNSMWALAMLVVMLPSFGGAGLLLLRHIRRSERDERARARLFAAALLLGVGSGMTDLFAVAGFDVPKLSLPGLVIAGGVLAALVLKAKLFERVTALTMVTAAVVAMVAVLALVMVFAWAGDELTLYGSGALVVCLALAAAMRPIVNDLSQQRARTEYLATLGRFAEQMAHDVRNPLAAIRGAAQFLKEERVQGRTMDDHEQFVDLIIERADRLERVVRDYQRIGRVEPELTRVDINQLLKNVLDDQPLSSDAELTVEAEFADDLPGIDGDPDLLTNALENVVRNAREAMKGDGQLHASTCRVSGSLGDRVCIRIRDTGDGMDVRVKERAREDFFTTKSEGSGLGLAFVARVFAAHGGTVGLESRPGHGTTVELSLPAAPGRPAK